MPCKNATILVYNYIALGAAGARLQYLLVRITRHHIPTQCTEVQALDFTLRRACVGVGVGPAVGLLVGTAAGRTWPGQRVCRVEGVNHDILLPYHGIILHSRL